MSTEPTNKTTFIRGNKRLNEVLADPDIAAGVAEVEVEAREITEHAAGS